MELLKKSYGPEFDEVVLQRRLDFEVGSGTSIAITGSSGKREDHSLNIIAGLDSPDASEVYVLIGCQLN